MAGDFSLSASFVHSYREIKPPFGFNGLGEFVYLRTYSRLKSDGTKEKWVDTVERVVNGVFSMLVRHLRDNNINAYDTRALYDLNGLAEEMFDRIFYMKFLPPGRGLWAMGTDIIEEKGLVAALQNCAFVSTRELTPDVFAFLMDASMLGVGVGFDTLGAYTKTVQQPLNETVFAIEDSREGWVESVKLLIQSYLVPGRPNVYFDYSQIRPAGAPIKTFGGVCTGYKPLMEAHESIRNILESNIGKKFTPRMIVDIMNLIGKCVVSGNVRRSAEIAFGYSNDSGYINLKNYEMNPDRAEYGWVSNNSIFAQVGMDYEPFADLIKQNGEPGFAWLSNMQEFSRMGEKRDYRDWRVAGGNPCLEQSLEHMELCTLVETFPTNHDSLDDFLATLEVAFLYAKIVTLGQVHWHESREVMNRNRRIGTSVTGIAQFIGRHGIDTLKTWLNYGYAAIKGYDTDISSDLRVPQSIKVSSVKPSGTVSLLAGTTPGVHFPESSYYIRRIRLGNQSDLLPALEEAGYHIEPAYGSENTTVVVEFPVSVNHGTKTLQDGVSLWEQLSLAAFMQEHWADNQVSCTVTFEPEEANQIVSALNYFQYKLKGISFLPKTEEGAYPQMPYEAITKEQYEKIVANIKPVNFEKQVEDSIGEKYCTTDVCLV